MGSDLLDDIELPPYVITLNDASLAHEVVRLVPGKQAPIYDEHGTMLIGVETLLGLVGVVHARPSPNGHAKHVSHQVECYGCGAKFSVVRRPGAGRHSWCESCKEAGEPAAQRARAYRARKRPTE